jgi:hypothetical protein
MTGRDENSKRRESLTNSNIWLWNLLFLLRPATNVKRTSNSKGVFDEKDCSFTGSSSRSGSCRAQHSQMEKTARKHDNKINREDSVDSSRMHISLDRY